MHIEISERHGDGPSRAHPFRNLRRARRHRSSLGSCDAQGGAYGYGLRHRGEARAQSDRYAAGRVPRSAYPIDVHTSAEEIDVAITRDDTGGVIMPGDEGVDVVRAVSIPAPLFDNMASAVIARCRTSAKVTGTMVQGEAGACDEKDRGGNVSIPRRRNGVAQWHFPYFDDEMGEAVGSQMAEADAMLLGRVTYQEFASYWPQQPDDTPGADFMNGVTEVRRLDEAAERR